MNTAAAVLFAAAAVVAVADWVAVDTDRKVLEYAAKPGTLLLLIAAALALEPASGTQRSWFVVALVFSLLGDVFLMLPQDLFVGGLASFLVGHVAYIVGFWQVDTSVAGFVVGSVIVVAAFPVLGTRIVGGLRTGSEREFLVPVVIYMVVIAAMTVSAGASGSALALAGATVFFASDATIAWNRFVQPVPRAQLAIMVTYHVAQAALVASLL